MKRIVLTLIFMLVLLSLTACGATKGSILITENIAGTRCKVEFNRWTEHGKWEVNLNRHDELQFEVICVSGDLSLEIVSKEGNEVYTGKHFPTRLFSVKVPKAGDYVVRIAGRNATGSIVIKNVGNRHY